MAAMAVVVAAAVVAAAVAVDSDLPLVNKRWKNPHQAEYLAPSMH